MLKNVVKCLLLLASSAVAVPYTVAFLCNVLYGWPQSRDKYKRAFCPRKVYSLNLAVIQRLMHVQYIPLMFQWVNFYRKADRDVLAKDLPYGRNGRTLDVYTPLPNIPTIPQPVVIFVYGGSWGSGDKSMYGLLCMQIATKLGAIVCCPNYSTYPQGYVDDMIQDIVDTVSWVHDNIETYNGDKHKIMLIGHSAGAHLAAMAILELLHDQSIQVPTNRRKQLQFDDQHYAGSNNSNNGSESSESFAVVSDNGEQHNMETSGATSTFEVLVGQQSGGTDEAAASVHQSDPSASVGGAESSLGGAESSIGGAGSSSSRRSTGVVIDVPSTAALSAGPAIDSSAGAKDASKSNVDGGLATQFPAVVVVDDDEEEDSADDDSVVTVRPKEIERHATLVDLSRSIRAFVGLAGVYNISDHYGHEEARGVEDISKMGRAMYGEDHFDRFSPTYIIRHLGRSINLPKMVLIHGTEDMVVPMSSTTIFSDALSDIFCDVMLRLILDCNHADLMIDLMTPDRKFYNSVMDILMATASRVF